MCVGVGVCCCCGWAWRRKHTRPRHTTYCTIPTLPTLRTYMRENRYTGICMVRTQRTTKPNSTNHRSPLLLSLPPEPYYTHTHFILLSHTQDNSANHRVLLPATLSILDNHTHAHTHSRIHTHAHTHTLPLCNLSRRFSDTQFMPC